MGRQVSPQYSGQVGLSQESSCSSQEIGEKFILINSTLIQLVQECLQCVLRASSHDCVFPPSELLQVRVMHKFGSINALMIIIIYLKEFIVSGWLITMSGIVMSLQGNLHIDPQVCIMGISLLLTKVLAWRSCANTKTILGYNLLKIDSQKACNNFMGPKKKNLLWFAVKYQLPT